jgi:hypothetical protein
MKQPKLDYNIGVCYYRLSQYARAKRAFLRAADHPPLRDLSHYNVALVESARNREDEARIWFGRVYSESDNARLKALAARRLGLEVAPERAGGSKWFGGFSTAVGYDDNIEDPSQTGVTDKGDNFAKLLLYTSGLLQGSHRNGLRLGLNGYFLRHQDVSAYDINLLQANLTKSFTVADWRNRAGVGLEQTSLGGDDYLQTVKLTMTGEMPLSASDALRLRYRYSSIASQDAAYDKLEGNRHEAELRWQRKRNSRRLRASYEYEVNDREDYQGATTFSSYSPTRHTLELRAGIEPAQAWEFDGRLAYRNSRYADANVLVGGGSVTREDDRLLAGVALSRRLSASLKVDLDYKYTDNDSNLDVYDYSRSIYSIGLSGSF